MLVGVDAKICSLCKVIKPIAAYYQYNLSKDGYRSQCISCHQQYNNKNTVPKLEYYYRDKAANPKKYLLKQAKARATKKNLPFDLILNDIVLPEKCPYFDRPFIYGDEKWTYSIDRKVPEKGYVKDNIEVISKLANCMKWNASPNELEAFAKGVLKRGSKEGSVC